MRMSSIFSSPVNSVTSMSAETGLVSLPPELEVEAAAAVLEASPQLVHTRAEMTANTESFTPCWV